MVACFGGWAPGFPFLFVVWWWFVWRGLVGFLLGLVVCRLIGLLVVVRCCYVMAVCVSGVLSLGLFVGLRLLTWIILFLMMMIRWVI